MANAINRYPTSNGLTRLPDLMDRLFQESFVMPSVVDRLDSTRPMLPVNLYEAGDGYTLQVSLPALKADDVDIQVIGREVSLKGSFVSTAPEDARWVWRGIPTGEFQETYTLPAEVQSDKVEASYENGILSVSLPKAEHLRPRNIKVSVKQ